MGQPERYLDAIRVALEALERETTIVQAVALTPRPTSWLRMLFVMSSCLSFDASDPLVVLLPALEEQLAASRHETEEACLQEVLLMEDRERMVVDRVWQGAGITLVALLLCTT